MNCGKRKRAQKFNTDDVLLTDLGSAPDWFNQISHAARPIGSATQIWVVTCRQYGISTLIIFSDVISRENHVSRCQLFPQAGIWVRHCRDLCLPPFVEFSETPQVSGPRYLVQMTGNGNSARSKSKEVKTVALLNTWCKAFFFFFFSFWPLVTIVVHHMDVFLLVKLINHT